jgi:hypothetical protein
VLPLLCVHPLRFLNLLLINLLPIQQTPECNLYLVAQKFSLCLMQEIPSAGNESFFEAYNRLVKSFYFYPETIRIKSWFFSIQA